MLAFLKDYQMVRLMAVVMVFELVEPLVPKWVALLEFALDSLLVTAMALEWELGLALAKVCQTVAKLDSLLELRLEMLTGYWMVRDLVHQLAHYLVSLSAPESVHWTVQ